MTTGQDERPVSVRPCGVEIIEVEAMEGLRVQLESSAIARPRLVARRHVDLLRVSSALCRGLLTRV